MLKGTRKALEGSIRKWGRIVAGTGKDDGGDNCPLCTRFPAPSCTRRSKSGDDWLETCPVTIKAGEHGCCNTPWVDWQIYQTNKGLCEPYSVFDARSRALARHELRHLKSMQRETPADG